MSTPRLTSAEQDLESLLRESDEPVAILLTEPYHPGSRVMIDRMQEAMRHERSLRFIRLSYASYRLWARRYQAYGTPSLLVFRGGKLKGRLLGLIESDSLNNALHEMLT